MNSDTFFSELVTYSELIETALQESFPSDSSCPHLVSLNRAIRYSLFGGGKRIRPLLALGAARACGGAVESALRTAIALECIHTYSLIHDDLPAMDDDDFRRGAPTLHKAFGEAEAILAGDLLLTRAFELVATDRQLSEPLRLQLVALIARRAGGEGMIGGQWMDIRSLDADSSQCTLEDLERRHQLKTGALINAALEAGALIAGADGSSKKALNRYGSALGLAFQIADDILDLLSPAAKGRSSDGERGLTTFVTLLGIEGAKKRVEELHNEAFSALKELPGEIAPLLELTRALASRSA